MKAKFFRRRQAFTLVEIMIVVTIIAVLASIGIPGFLRARKRSQAGQILNDLRLIDSAVDTYAIENNKPSGNTVAVTDWTKYLKTGTNLYITGADVMTNSFGPQTVDTIPKVNGTTYDALSDVAPDPFWSPYH